MRTEKLYRLSFFSDAEEDFGTGFDIGLFVVWEDAQRVAVRYRKEILGFKDFDCDGYFDTLVSLLNHLKSLVRNRALHILAANAQWDDNNRFDAMLSEYLSHIMDEKPITTRQCIKALVQACLAKPQYIPRILSCFKEADFFKYKDSMHLLIERDMGETKRILTNSGLPD